MNTSSHRLIAIGRRWGKTFSVLREFEERTLGHEGLMALIDPKSSMYLETSDGKIVRYDRIDSFKEKKKNA
jgi:hypothetical protein